MVIDDLSWLEKNYLEFHGRDEGLRAVVREEESLIKHIDMLVRKALDELVAARMLIEIHYLTELLVHPWVEVERRVDSPDKF